jgi:hypothetical protein
MRSEKLEFFTKPDRQRHESTTEFTEPTKFMAEQNRTAEPSTQSDHKA